MADVLNATEIAYRRKQIPTTEMREVLDSHEELRARLESAERERDEARQTANGAENNRKWAQGLLDIAETEREAALAALREIREIIGIDDPMIQESLHMGYDFAIEVGQVKRLAELLLALGAAGEEQEPAGG